MPRNSKTSVASATPVTWEAELCLWEFSAPAAERADRQQLAQTIRALRAGPSTSLVVRDLRQLTALPPSLPEGLTSLALSGCPALTRLPEKLPASLLALGVIDCGALSQLPALPSSLNNLVIRRCTGLTGLPALPAKLRYLEIGGPSALRTLPALPARLRSLDLLWCEQLTHLPPLPNRLRQLGLRNCSALTGVPALPPRLQLLNLSGSTSLSAVPDLPSSLTQMNLAHCSGLRSLPSLPEGLQRLDLNHCSQLRHLPPKRLADLERLDLSGCGALSGLPDWVESVPQLIRTDLPTELNPAAWWYRHSDSDEPLIIERQQAWSRMREAVRNTVQQVGLNHFEQMLQRLSELRRRVDNTWVVHREVIAVLDEVLLASPEHRALILEAAEGAGEFCHDNPLSLLVDVEAQARASALARSGAAPGALLDLACAMFKQTLLDQAALQVMHKQWNEGVDRAQPVSERNPRRRTGNPDDSDANFFESREVQLALRQRLAARLGLPFAARGGQYTSLAGLDDSDQAFAARQVERQFADGAQRSAGLLAQPMWQRYLAQQYAAELEQCNAPFLQQMSELDQRQDTLGEQAYLAAGQQLVAARDAAVQQLWRQKTDVLWPAYQAAWIARLPVFLHGAAGHDGYLTRLQALQQRLEGYCAEHPASRRVAALRGFSEQLATRARALRGFAALAPIEQLALAQQLAQGDAMLPSVSTVQRQAAVFGKRRGAAYQAILADLDVLQTQQLTPPDGYTARAPRERLLSWRAVRDRVAPAFALYGHTLDAQVRHAPQAIWLDGDDAATRRGLCAGLSRAALLDAASGALLDNLFVAAAEPDDPVARQFRQDIQRLQAGDSQRAPLAAISSWRQAIASLSAGNGQRGAQIDLGNHSVALLADGSGAATRYTFFDPNAGAWSQVRSAEKLERALDGYFNAELRRQYGFDGRLRAFVLQAPAAGTASERALRRVNQPLLTLREQLARQDRAFGPLAIGELRVTRQELMAQGATLGGRAIGVDSDWSRLGAIRWTKLPITAVSGSGLRAYGVYHSLSAMLSDFRQGRSGDALRNLGEMLSEFAGEALERGSARLGGFLQQALRRASSPLARIGHGIGRWLARGAGMLGNLLTLPFDLYTAITSFQDSASRNGLERQDLLFAGSMATLGATVGLGLALAAAAGAGAVAGPLGLAFGAVMIATAQIYSAVRQVQEVERWVSLSAAQKLALGWRYFTGQGIDLDTEQRAQQARVDPLLRQLARDEAQRLLADPLIGAVLIPTPQSVSRLLRGTTPDDHAHQHLQRGRSETGGGYEIFLQASDDSIDARALSDIGATYTLYTKPGEPAANLALVINAGNGNDQVIGAVERPNRIEVGSGDKTVSGGARDDLFILNAHPAWNDRAPSLAVFCRASDQLANYRYAFDGGAGSDTLVLDTRFEHSHARGYRVDLAARSIDLIERDGGFTPLGSVRQIEHLLHALPAGGAPTQHQLWGDEQANTLSGSSGDRLYGRGGNDLLRLAGSASADGGDGDDVYQIAMLFAGDHVILRDSGRSNPDTAARSIVYLDFSLQLIRDWRIVGLDLQLTLHSGASITVQRIYEERDGRRALAAGSWTFATQDGFVLQPALPGRLASVAWSVSDFSVDLRYVKNADCAYANDRQGLELDLAARRLAPRAGAEPPVNAVPLLAQGQGALDGVSLLPAGRRVLALDSLAAEVRVSLRYRTERALLSASTARAQTLGLEQLDVLLQINGSTLTLDALPWLRSSQLCIDGGELLALFEPDAMPRLVSRDGYQIGWRRGAPLRIPLPPSARATLAQALGSNNLHLFELSASGQFDAELPAVGARASYWQAAGGMTLDARYRLSGEGSDYDDVLRGTPGNDLLRAGAGNDRLIGRGGNDVFVVEALPGTVGIDTRAASGSRGANVLALACTLEQLYLSSNQGDVLVTARMNSADASGATAQKIIRHEGGASADPAVAPLFIVDQQQAELHWQMDATTGEIAAYVQIAGVNGSCLSSRAARDNILLGRAGADRLSAHHSGSLLSGGAGADRYEITLSGADSANGALYYLDNQAEDEVLDTLEIHTGLPWERFALARRGDDLCLSVLARESAPVESVNLLLLDYYARAQQRHLALELCTPDGNERISASELEQAALDPATPRLPALDSARLERLIQASAAFGAQSAASSAPLTLSQVDLPPPPLAVSQ